MKRIVAGIYKYENLINGKKYIGQSICIIDRLSCHKKLIRNNKDSRHLQHSINKHGIENFSIEIVCEVATIIRKPTKEDKKYLREFLVPQLNYWEQYYMNLWETYNPKMGYNIMRFVTIDNNRIGILHSEESKRLIREHCPDRRGSLNPMYGINVEDLMTQDAIIEKRRKNGDAHRGQKNHNFGISPKDRLSDKSYKQLLENSSKAQKIAQNRPELKEAKSKRIKGENNPMFGKHHTEEAKLAIGSKSGTARKGKKRGLYKNNSIFREIVDFS